MRVVPALWLAVSAIGCSVPELDAQKFACATNADCGPGWVCNPQSTRNFCVEANRNTNGVFDDRLVLGVLLDLSDTAIGQLGQAGLAGYQAFVKQVNASGGVHGRRIDLVAKSSPYLDARTKPEAVGRLLADLLGGENRQAFALVGVVGTDPSLLAEDFVTENQVLFFGPATGADALEQDPPNRYVFNVRGRYSQESAQLTRMFLGGSLDTLTPVRSGDVAVFAQGSLASSEPDDFGKSGVDGVKRAVADAGGQADKVAVATYGFILESGLPRPVVEGAANELLRWLADADRAKDRGDQDPLPVAIVLVALADAAAPLIRIISDELGKASRGVALDEDRFGTFTDAELARLKRIKLAFGSLSSVGTAFITLLAPGSYQTMEGGKIVDNRYGAGTIIISPMPDPRSDATGVRQFREDLAALDPDIPPNPVSLEGYVYIRVLIDALEEQGRDLNTESLIATLESFQTDIGIGTVLQFSPDNHQATDKLWGVQLEPNLTPRALGLVSDFGS